MNNPRQHRGWILSLLGCGWLALAPVAAVKAAENFWRGGPATGYADEATFAKRVQELDQHEWVTVSSLGKTAQGRDIQLLTVSIGKPADKPALLVVGHTHGPHVVGGELALRMVTQLIAKPDDAATKQLLERVTLYVIPRPSPDMTAACFAMPQREPAGNGRTTDDDRDGSRGEDPPDDLNADGLLTMMRVADPSGTHRVHPDEPRLMIPVDVAKNERGTHRLLPEGRDQDGDEQFNEDAGAGVAFDRNFPHRYPAFQRQAGPQAVSEPETRAVADFAFDHPHIAAVLSFTPEDNLFHVWKSGPGSEQRIKTAVLAADAPYYDFMASRYRELHAGENPPAAAPAAGSFVEWAYYQFGRWSFGARAWWVPPVKAAEKAPAEKEAGEKTPTEKAKESRGADERNALRWFEQQQRPGFVAWQKVEHPDFPGKLVEVGGFAPFARQTPPEAALDPLAQIHLKFLGELAGWLPRLEIQPPKVTSLGGGLYRVEVEILNQGYLPTEPEMARVAEQDYPAQLELELPAGAKLVQGATRKALPRLTGQGGKAQHEWLILAGELPDAKVGISVKSPLSGQHHVTTALKAN